MISCKTKKIWRNCFWLCWTWHYFNERSLFHISKGGCVPQQRSLVAQCSREQSNEEDQDNTFQTEADESCSILQEGLGWGRQEKHRRSSCTHSCFLCETQKSKVQSWTCAAKKILHFLQPAIYNNYLFNTKWIVHFYSGTPKNCIFVCLFVLVSFLSFSFRINRMNGILYVFQGYGFS